MMQTSDNVFIHSNIIIYCHTDIDINKQEIAQDIVNIENTIISSQVVNECINVFHKKYNFTWTNILLITEEIQNNFLIKIIKTKTIENAIKICEKYKYSYYDSLIISSALENNCKILYSEDLQHNHIIEKSLKIVNPFL